MDFFFKYHSFLAYNLFLFAQIIISNVLYMKFVNLRNNEMHIHYHLPFFYLFDDTLQHTPILKVAEL